MFNLATAMAAIDGREEFAVKRRDGLVVINYLVALPDSFDGIRENFRGIVFDEATGEIISLPLHKFYNVNQKEHTHQHLIGDQVGVVLDKFDGTMVHGLEVGGEIVLASRMGWDTQQAIHATKLMNKNPDVAAEVSRVVRSGWTPIFEYVGPDNPVVLNYPVDELVYLWSRDRSTGRYTRSETISGMVRSPAARLMSVNEVMDETATLENREGFVIVLPNLWVKAKCQWYLDRHRAFDMLMKPAYFVYEYALDGKIDDIISLCAESFRPRLRQVMAEVTNDQIRLYRELFDEYSSIISTITDNDSARERRKQFAIAAKRSCNFNGLMTMYSGKQTDSWLRGILFYRYRNKYTSRLFANVSDE